MITEHMLVVLKSWIEEMGINPDFMKYTPKAL
jgi:hypothetical protein